MSGFGSGFSVDPDVIARGAADLETAADQLDQLLTQFTSSLSGVGDPWGTDTLGTLIGGGYVAIEQLALQTYSSVVDGFDGFVEGLEQMADEYRQAENTSTTDVTTSGTGL